MRMRRIRGVSSGNFKGRGGRLIYIRLLMGKAFTVLTLRGFLLLLMDLGDGSGIEAFFVKFERNRFCEHSGVSAYTYIYLLDEIPMLG